MDIATIKTLHPNLSDAAADKLVATAEAIAAAKAQLITAPDSFAKDTAIRRLDGALSLVAQAFAESK